MLGCFLGSGPGFVRFGNHWNGLMREFIFFQSSEHPRADKDLLVPDGPARHLLHRVGQHRVELVQEPRLLLSLQSSLENDRTDILLKPLKSVEIFTVIFDLHSKERN